MTETLNALHKKIDQLPEDAQYALLEYVDFLAHKYHIGPEPDEEYDALLKEFLLKRYEKMKANRQESLSLEELRDQVNRKYGRKV
ncbi:MAG: hypothetical protein MUD08_03645 [Cytophagales bacterium]|jgi:hypothetical protein|nr:hypothetical protein [Cytophagales bacterium]